MAAVRDVNVSTEPTSQNIDVAALYKKYGPMVYRRCYAILKDDGLAQDAMQDVFVQVLRKQDALHAQAPSSLLYHIATNTSLNRLRSMRRRPQDKNSEQGDDVLLAIANIDDHTDAEDRSVWKQAIDVVLGRTHVSTRLIAALHYLDGMTYEEIAAEVGLSVSGVRKRLRTLRAGALAQHPHLFDEASV